MAARCCGLFSYRVAEENLRELCGISFSYVTLSDFTLAVADEMKEQQEHDPTQRECFQQAKGETMFGADGTSVHSRHADGTKQWREMKVGVLAKRERGKRALPEETATWFEERRLVLLSEGFSGLERELQNLRKGLKAKRRKAVDSLLRYLEGNKDRMNYWERHGGGCV